MDLVESRILGMSGAILMFLFRKQNSDAGFDNRILIHFDKKSMNMLESKLTLPAIDLGPRGQNLACNALP